MTITAGHSWPPATCFQGALEMSGLPTDETVWQTVAKIAHRAHVKIQETVVKLEMDNPESWIHEFTRIPIAQEYACLDKTIDRVATDLEPMRHRANLWAVGDVDGLLASTFPDDQIACFNALFSVPASTTNWPRPTAGWTMSGWQRRQRPGSERK